MSRRPSSHDYQVTGHTRPVVPVLRTERGAILVQTAAMLISLTALSAFIVDYGILWTSRRQIQNAADAAAMAAATSLAFDAPGDQARARANAITAVSTNKVWGQAASIENNDISFAPCPTGSVGRGTCVQVNVFRNEAHGSALPTIFGTLVGVNEQGVRATATAQVLYGNSSDCVRPLAIPDRWEEQRGNLGTAGWDIFDTFERYRPNGQLLPGAVDLYDPPGSGVFGPNGTGFSRDATGYNGADYGLTLEFSPTPNPMTDSPGGRRFVPVRISGNGPGAFLQDLTTCSPRVIRAGNDIDTETANIDGETIQGINTLVAQDPGAYWDPSKFGGRGGVAGGCMASGDCNLSPRIIALPVFDPDQFDLDPHGVIVTRIAGFFVEHLETARVIGQLMVYPAAPRSSMTTDPTSSFVISVALVR